MNNRNILKTKKCANLIFFYNLKINRQLPVNREGFSQVGSAVDESVGLASSDTRGFDSDVGASDVAVIKIKN